MWRLIFLWVGPDSRLGLIPGAFYGGNLFLDCVEYEVSIALNKEDTEDWGSWSSAAQAEAGIADSSACGGSFSSDAESQLPLRTNACGHIARLPFRASKEIAYLPLVCTSAFVYCLPSSSQPSLCPSAQMKRVRLARVLEASPTGLLTSATLASLQA